MYIFFTTIPCCREQTHTRFFYKRGLYMSKPKETKNLIKPPPKPPKQRSKCAELLDFKQHQHLYLFSSDQSSKGCHRVSPRLYHHDAFPALKCSFAELSPTLMPLQRGATLQGNGIDSPCALSQRKGQVTRARPFQARPFSWSERGVQFPVVGKARAGNRSYK